MQKKRLDRCLEHFRFAKAKPHIPEGSRLLDIGTGDGAFLRYLNGHIAVGIGIDPILTDVIEYEAHQLIPGYFPQDFTIHSTFDIITLLAVVEHLPEDKLKSVVEACWGLLVSGGCVIITVPHPFVDKILNILKFFRLIEGMALEEHHGFNPEQLPDNFRRWTLLRKERWEFGCNYLFIFEKP